MKGQTFESPRGPMTIDAQTRDVVHNVYVRRVDRVDGQLWNVEIQTTADVKDIGKTRGAHGIERACCSHWFWCPA
jgi:branched-chain amino acid transport system substrate-binding protein